jgi:hypothetical protein
MGGEGCLNMRVDAQRMPYFLYVGSSPVVWVHRGTHHCQTRLANCHCVHMQHYIRLSLLQYCAGCRH